MVSATAGHDKYFLRDGFAAEWALSTDTRGVREVARKNLQVVRQAYELGRHPLLDVIAEQRRYIEVEIGYTDVLKRAYDATDALERALGVVPHRNEGKVMEEGGARMTHVRGLTACGLIALGALGSLVLLRSEAIFSAPRPSPAAAPSPARPRNRPAPMWHTRRSWR